MPIPADWEPHVRPRPVHRWGWPLSPQSLSGMVLSLGLASCQSLAPDTSLPPIPPSHTLTRVMPPTIAPPSSDIRAAVSPSVETPPPPAPVQAALVLPPPPVAEAPPSAPTPVIADGPSPIIPATTREDALLLPLLQQEEVLLQKFGSEHPQVKAVQAKIVVVRKYLEQYPTEHEREAATVSKPTDGGPWSVPLTSCGDKFENCAAGGDKFENLAALFATSIETKLPLGPDKPAAEPVLKPVPTVSRSPSGTPDPGLARFAGPAAATSSVWATATAQFLGTAAALLFGLVLQIAGIAYVLRRYGPRLTPAVRVEMTAPPAQPPTVVMSRGPRRKPLKTKAARLPVDPREAVILQQVFEDNLRLHDELTSAA